MERDIICHVKLKGLGETNDLAGNTCTKNTKHKNELHSKSIWL